MKMIDAIWEKRNLGVDVQEIICDGTETAQMLEGKLTKIYAAYSVLKIPSGCTELLLAAQSLGYTFVETGMEITGKVRSIGLPAIYQRFATDIRLQQADDEMMDRILAEIESGEVFETDRIAIDPVFSKKTAGIRYANWTRDEVEKGAETMVAYYKDKPVAYGINKPCGDNVYDAFLGGLLLSWKNTGLGFMGLYANTESIRRQGGTRIVTHVSSNNPAILRLHLQFGYEIAKMQYVLIKHQ